MVGADCRLRSCRCTMRGIACIGIEVGSARSTADLCSCVGPSLLFCTHMLLPAEQVQYVHWRTLKSLRYKYNVVRSVWYHGSVSRQDFETTSLVEQLTVRCVNHLSEFSRQIGWSADLPT